MQLPMGEAAHCVPFSTRDHIKMTLYKGPDALAPRRAVAKALTPSLIKALQRPRTTGLQSGGWENLPSLETHPNHRTAER